MPEPACGHPCGGGGGTGIGSAYPCGTAMKLGFEAQVLRVTVAQASRAPAGPKQHRGVRQARTELPWAQGPEHRPAWGGRSPGAQDAGSTTVLLLLALGVCMEQLWHWV